MSKAVQLNTNNMDLIQHLDYLFNPRSAAVIGASSIPGKWGCDILNLLLTNGERNVYPINQSKDEVLGVKAYSSITEVPEPVDFVAITIAAETIPAAIEDCVKNGVKTALIISGGFAETGESGAQLEREVLEIAQRGGIRFIGPNCAGHVNTYAELFTAPYLPQLAKGPISLLTQSGNLGLMILAMLHELGLGLNKYVSSGNEADLNFEDYLEYLGQDDETRLIMCYVEGLRDGKRFLELTREITKKKPVIIMKVGGTDCGARACSSHTSAMAGTDEFCEAAFRQTGVTRVNEVDELIDFSQVLLGQPMPRGNRVAILTVGGGLGVIATDALKRHGLDVPLLSPATLDKLNSVLSGRWSQGNPVDTSGDISYPCIVPLLEDENIDAVMITGPIWMPFGFAALMSTAPWERDYTQNIDQILQDVADENLRNLETIMQLMQKYQKPIVLSAWISNEVKSGKVYKKMQENQLIPYPTPDRAAKALAQLVKYSEYLGIARNNTKL